jgi:hypothetical protein
LCWREVSITSNPRRRWDSECRIGLWGETTHVLSEHTRRLLLRGLSMSRGGRAARRAVRVWRLVLCSAKHQPFLSGGSRCRSRPETPTS